MWDWAEPVTDRERREGRSTAPPQVSSNVHRLDPEVACGRTTSQQEMDDGKTRKL